MILGKVYSKLLNPTTAKLFRYVGIAKEIGVGTSTIDRELAKMAHLVRRIGSKNGGHWERSKKYRLLIFCEIAEYNRIPPKYDLLDFYKWMSMPPMN